MATKRTNIELDTVKVSRAKKISGLSTTKDVVNYALDRMIAGSENLEKVFSLVGKIKFQRGYDYKASR